MEKFLSDVWILACTRTVVRFSVPGVVGRPMADGVDVDMVEVHGVVTHMP